VVDSNNGHAGTDKLEFQRFHRLRWNVLESAGIPSPAGIHRIAGIPLRWTVLDSINGSSGTCWNSFTLEFPSWNPARPIFRRVAHADSVCILQSVQRACMRLRRLLKRPINHNTWGLLCIDYRQQRITEGMPPLIWLIQRRKGESVTRGCMVCLLFSGQLAAG